MARLTLEIKREAWPLKGAFTISRGSRTESEVVVATISDGTVTGRGECVPYRRYGETIEGVMRDIEGMRPALEQGLDRRGLQSALPAGAARNALDCAFWDLESKLAGKRAWDLAGLPEPLNVVTAYTLSLDTPEKMGEAALAAASRPLLKLKLAGPEDLDRVAAVRKNAADARLIVDANEGWDINAYRTLAPKLADLGVTMIEQPLPAGDDDALSGEARPVPLCADESCHDRSSLSKLTGKYDFINIKLDKAGGLTEALALRQEAEKAGYRIMVGCMMATSLAMAPAMLVAQGVEVTDLDGPLWMAKDRTDALQFEGSRMVPPSAKLWG
ncbi:N-acetyl-D-Glu racemase DgcA [Limibacillus halophilus]|uniref:Dipeptide epimerase n=1 Tax=Limibacillus halophilus TaxID=1579333 RepID=A0A839SVY3_9PROT|nr:N-acetyl-D-Glu racemase DgcA [Limibacillus halophilus]MBB3066957.1 L-alanine-DL-glutamate epimerase-like enolase superfamily enzyme [Limibacillus halophilus]